MLRRPPRSTRTDTLFPYTTLFRSEGDALTGPALLSCTLCGLKDFETKPLPLQRLCRLARSGRLLKSLYPPERRARRWTLLLRAFDGAVFGASQRDIAAVLVGDRAVRVDWEAGSEERRGGTGGVRRG